MNLYRDICYSAFEKKKIQRYYPLDKISEIMLPFCKRNQFFIPSSF